MHPLNRVSQHPHTGAICKSDTLYSAFKSHLASKAYLFLKHKALESFSFWIYCSIVLFTGVSSSYGLFPQTRWGREKNVDVHLLWVQFIHSFIHPVSSAACLRGLRHNAKYWDPRMNKIQPCSRDAHSPAVTYTNDSNQVLRVPWQKPVESLQ